MMANFPSAESGGSGGGLDVPSDQIFDSVSLRDAYFTTNPAKLKEGAQCIVLTSPPSGLYQVYNSGAWVDHSEVVVGKTGDAGDPTLLIDDSQALLNKTYSSNKVENLVSSSVASLIDDSTESTDKAYSSEKTNEAIAAHIPVFVGSENEIMKMDSNGNLVPSGVVSKKDGSLSVGSGSIDIGTHTISSAGEGVGVTNDSTSESYSFVFSGQGDDTGPVHRILGAESVIETVTSKTLDLTNHISKFTAQSDIRVLRKPFTIDAVSPQTNVVMQVEDLAGSDLWTYGPFDITTGINVFTPDTILDFRVGQYLIEFISKDGDVTLKGGISPISGLDIVYALIPTKPWIDETLANVKSENSIVREISADPTSDITTSIDVSGNLIIGRNYTPDTSSADVAFWWSANEIPTPGDVLNALGQVQTSTIISHRDGILKGDLKSKTFTALRETSAFEYLFFAWPAGFFVPEPTKIDTGFGSPSVWKPTLVTASGVVYNVLTVEVRNNGLDAQDYGLVQEGSR